MTPARERLVQLSELAGGSAAQHLRQIARFAGVAGITAGALLVAYSGLPTGGAEKHLLADQRGGIDGQYEQVRRAIDARTFTAVKPREAPLVAAAVDIPAVLPANPGESVLTIHPDWQDRSLPLHATVNTSNQPLALADTAQVAIKLVATKDPIYHGDKTTQTVQATQEGQPTPGFADLSSSAASVQTARQDEELALIMILLEATA